MKAKEYIKLLSPELAARISADLEIADGMSDGAFIGYMMHEKGYDISDIQAVASVKYSDGEMDITELPEGYIS